MTYHAVVNVNNIYIPKPSRIFVKPGAGGALEFILGCPKDPMAAPAAARAASGPPGLFGRAADGRSGSRGRADRSTPPLPEGLPPTSAACGVPHRHERTATPHRATSTRYAVPSSVPAGAACRVAPARLNARRRPG